MKVIFAGAILSSIFCGAFSAESNASSELSRHLRDFHENPAEVMNRIPQKYDNLGRPLPHDELQTRFAPEDISSGMHVFQRDEVRQQILGPMAEKAAYTGNDRPESLVGRSNLIRDLEEMEESGLKNGSVALPAWSDSYWPTYDGQIGARYADPRYPSSREWQENYNYVIRNPLREIFESGSSREIARLSPSEKYDLLVGDYTGTLTRFVWGRARKFGSSRVPTWHGLCHGWAAAAHMDPEPISRVQAIAADGDTILDFYPSDIKGLMTALWANAMPRSRFIGARCRISDPSTDRNGRTNPQQCFDTNPGTWHLAVVNRIGVDKKGFVMDATYDLEVWNHPVASYQYKYFNPESLEETDSLDAAMIRMRDFTRDKFSKYRSGDAKYVVGISMMVTYVTEMLPNHDDTHGAPPRKTVRYVYDLELDDYEEIIGGEWYTNRHPDFLWGFSDNTKSVSIVDPTLPDTDWDEDASIPRSWRSQAQRASSRGQPIARIIRFLTEFSRR